MDPVERTLKGLVGVILGVGLTSYCILAATCCLASRRWRVASVYALAAVPPALLTVGIWAALGW